MQLQWIAAVLASLMTLGCGAFASVAFFELKEGLSEGTFAASAAGAASVAVGTLGCGVCLTQGDQAMQAASNSNALLVGGLLGLLTVALGVALVLSARNGKAPAQRKGLAVLAAVSGLALSFCCEHLVVAPAFPAVDSITIPVSSTLLGIIGGMSLHMTALTYTAPAEKLACLNTPLMVTGAAAAAAVIATVLAGGYNETGDLGWGVAIIFGGVGPGTMSWLVSNNINELTGNVSTPSWAALICAFGGTVGFHAFVWIALLGTML